MENSSLNSTYAPFLHFLGEPKERNSCLTLIQYEYLGHDAMKAFELFGSCCAIVVKNGPHHGLGSQFRLLPPQHALLPELGLLVWHEEKDEIEKANQESKKI
jgi:hypothetical protein